MERYEEFGGRIGRTQAESEPWWPPTPDPGPDAPNVVVILLDDLGLLPLRLLRLDIDTPNIDRLAAGGLRYTNFHVTPLCSPTRAALLTGRNHHAVGMRSVSNFNTGFPHMRGHISNHAATVGRGAARRGLHHVRARQVAPVPDGGRLGRRARTTSGRCQRGFDRFYGFLDGETDQFHPELVYDNHRVDPPAHARGRLPPERGPGRPRDRVRPRHQVDPARPAVLHVPRLRRHARAAPGAAPSTWTSTAGRFDDGLGRRPRALVRAPARARGSSRPDTELAPRNPGVEPWDELPENHRRLAARLQEAFAAFLDHTDDQIGRLVDELDALGQLDNTVIVAAVRQRRQPGGRPVRRAARDEVLQLHPRDARRGRRPPRRHRRPAQPHQLPVGLGPGRQHAVQVVQAEHPRGRRPRAAASCTGRRRSADARRACATSSTTSATSCRPSTRSSASTPPDGLPRARADAGHRARRCAYTLDRRRDAPSRKRVQYFEMMGHRAHLRRRLEGRDPPPARRAASTTTAGSCTTSPRTAPSATTSPPSEPERLAELVELWWQRGRGARRAARSTTAPIELFGARFRDRSPHPVEPPLHLPAADVAAARAGRRRRSAGAAGTSTPTIDRPAGAGGVLYATGTENSGCQPVRRRTTAWCSTTTASATTTWSRSDRRAGPGGRSWSACGSGATGSARHRHPGHRRRRVRDRSTMPVRHAHDLERRAPASATTTARR